MNEHLLTSIIFAIMAVLIFLWDNYKIKHGKYDIPTYPDRSNQLFTGAWRWVYNWGWVTVGMSIVEFNKFLGL